MARLQIRHLTLMLVSSFGLSACEDGKEFNLFKKKADFETTDRAAPAASSVKLVERDVEAPEVFQATEAGLWDGRPSLGGVWVAHADVKDPERVIIRNEANGKFVIGALFRRERENPGPKFQISSDAAAALGMLAGAPSSLNVTALRRAEVPLADETANNPLPSPDAIETASLDPIAAASAALDKAEAAESATPSVSVSTPTAKPAATQTAAVKPASSMSKPFIQIGFFSVEENATRTGTVLRGAGVVPSVEKNNARGKDYWRVIVGPATNSAERTALLKKIKDLGYSDAYFVSN